MLRRIIIRIGWVLLVTVVILIIIGYNGPVIIEISKFLYDILTPYFN